jgi:hypothetical protein
VTDPTLRFGGEDSVAQVDPTVQSEDLGSDPIEATTYGLKNIARVARLLIPATTRLGEDYSLLDETYGGLLDQRTTELMHVAKLVGGVVETRYHGGRGGDVFRPVPRAQQSRAVRFLVSNALSTPRDLLLPEILHRIEPSGAADRVLNTQRLVLANLLSEARIKRLEDQEAADRGTAYPVLELVATLQGGVWGELSQPQPVVDVYRQNLQRAYLELMKGRLSGEAASRTSLRAIGVGSLRELAKQIDTALPRVQDRVTAMHLRQSRKDIERIVNPKS